VIPVTGRLWRFVVDIYEPGTSTAYPVLRHVFFGVDEDEAYGYFEAHMTTDEFLRGCVEKGRWNGLDCIAKAKWLAPGQAMDET
jgi:hypothetical protein